MAYGTTWGDLVKIALIEIGVNVQGEDASDDDYDLGIRVLRELLHDWAADGYFIAIDATVTGYLQLSNIDSKVTKTGSYNGIGLPTHWPRAIRLNLAILLATFYAIPEANLQIILRKAAQSKNLLLKSRKAIPAALNVGEIAKLAMTDLNLVSPGKEIREEDIEVCIRATQEILHLWRHQDLLASSVTKTVIDGIAKGSQLHSYSDVVDDATFSTIVRYVLSAEIAPTYRVENPLLDMVINRAAVAKPQLRNSLNSYGTTFKDLIKMSLVEIGVKRIIEEPTPKEIDNGLRVLRDMLHGWENEGFFIQIDTTVKNHLEKSNISTKVVSGGGYTSIGLPEHWPRIIRLNLAVLLSKSYQVPPETIQVLLQEAALAKAELMKTPTITIGKTYQDLIRMAFIDIGHVKVAENLKDTDINYGINMLRQMLTDWANNGYFIVIDTTVKNRLTASNIDTEIVKAGDYTADGLPEHWPRAMRLNLAVFLAKAYPVTDEVRLQVLVKEADEAKAGLLKDSATTVGTTYKDIVRGALIDIGYKKDTEALTDAETNYGINVLRQMMKDWESRGYFAAIATVSKPITKSNITAKVSASNDYTSDGLPEHWPRSMRLNLAVLLAKAYSITDEVRLQVLVKEAEEAKSCLLKDSSVAIGTTYKDMVRGALIDIGYKKDSEVLTENETDLGIETLRQMMEDWSEKGYFTTIDESAAGKLTTSNITTKIVSGGDYTAQGLPRSWPRAMRLNLAVLLAKAYSIADEVRLQVLVKEAAQAKDELMQQDIEPNHTAGTFWEIVRGALIDIGYKKDSEVLTNREINHGMVILRNMLHDWEASGYMNAIDLTLNISSDVVYNQSFGTLGLPDHWPRAMRLNLAVLLAKAYSIPDDVRLQILAKEATQAEAELLKDATTTIGTTYKDIVRMALIDIGYKGVSDKITDAETNHGINTLRQMLKDWESKGYFVAIDTGVTGYLKQSNIDSLVVEAGSYTDDGLPKHWPRAMRLNLAALLAKAYSITDEVRLQVLVKEAEKAKAGLLQTGEITIGTTYKDIVRMAFIDIGYKTESEQITDNETNYGINILRQMLKDWEASGHFSAIADISGKITQANIAAKVDPARAYTADGLPEHWPRAMRLNLAALLAKAYSITDEVRLQVLVKEAAQAESELLLTSHIPKKNTWGDFIIGALVNIGAKTIRQDLNTEEWGLCTRLLRDMLRSWQLDGLLELTWASEQSYTVAEAEFSSGTTKKLGMDSTISGENVFHPVTHVDSVLYTKTGENRVTELLQIRYDRLVQKQKTTKNPPRFFSYEESRPTSFIHLDAVMNKGDNIKVFGDVVDEVALQDDQAKNAVVDTKIPKEYYMPIRQTLSAIFLPYFNPSHPLASVILRDAREAKRLIQSRNAKPILNNATAYLGTFSGRRGYLH